MTVDIMHKDSTQIIYDLINDTNPVAGISPAVATLGTPTVLTEGDQNTSVVCTAVAPIAGTVTVTYNRLALNIALGSGVVLPYDPAKLTLADYFPDIESKYGIRFLETDIKDSTELIDWTFAETNGFYLGNLFAADTCLAYTVSASITIQNYPTA